MGRVEHLGNGRMIAALCGGDLLNLQVPIPGVALCSLSAQGYLHAESTTDPITGIRTCSMIAETVRLRCTDFIHPTLPVLVRRMECYDSLRLVLSKPPNVKIHITYHDQDARILLFGPRGSKLAHSRTTGEDTVLTLTVRGNATPGENGIILVHPGKSELIFCGGVSTGEVSYALNPPKSEEILQQVYANTNPTVKTATLRELIHRQCASGGVLHDAVNCECLAEEQYHALKAFCEAGLFSRAREIIRFLLSGYRQNGFIAWSCDPQAYPIRRGAYPAAVCAAYPVICAREYDTHTSDKRNLRTWLPELAEITASQLPLVKGGHLPFNGNEPELEPPFPARLLYAGSRRSDALFLDSVQALSELLPKIPVKIKGVAALQRAAQQVSAAAKDYESAENPNTTPERTRHIRSPQTLFTYCQSCAERQRAFHERVCVRNREGSYLCPVCTVTKE